MSKPIITYTIIILLSFGFLSGCGSKDTKTTGLTPFERQPGPEELIAQAQVSNPQLGAELYLRAADQYWQNNLVSQALAVMKDIDPALLSDPDKAKLFTRHLELLLLTLDENRIRATLQQLQQNQPQKISIDDKQALLNVTHDAYLAISQPIAAATVLIENIGIYDGAQIDTIQEQIWKDLKSADINDLRALQSSSNYDVAGWASLTVQLKENQFSLEQQHSALMTWFADWPSHPATVSPPSELLILQELPESRPKEIILALPFSGSLAEAGLAIRDGFMAAHYQGDSDLAKETVVSFYDTNTRKINDLYEQAHDPRSLVVGPLDKSALEDLLQQDSITIPTLALNRLDQPFSGRDNLFQFGLSPEAGTDQVAEALRDKNYSRIAVIAPDSAWGTNIVVALELALAEKNITIIETAEYAEQKGLSEAVSKLLATDASQNRARKIRRITGLRFETEPRRRQDLDAIFMVAKPKIARQIKPLLSFHYAGNLPVFASTQIHNPNEKNDDLNGIEFLEMPWMLTNTNQLKSSIERLLPSATRYSRFYALGVDAYKLAPRLKLLSNIEDSMIQGETGQLSLSPNGIVQRHMQWARFVRGKAIAQGI